MKRPKSNICTRRSALIILGAALPAGYVAAHSPRRSRIPFLITADVHDQPNLDNLLSRCLDRLAFLGLKVTFFVPAELTTKTGVAPLLRKMVRDGHQVACHGRAHNESEDYYTDSVEVQRLNLTYAKHLMEDSTGISATSFRAPQFRISDGTFNVLEALGFASDLSICSQRLPLLSSQIGNYHWLFAPRTPYHPSKTNPYAKGDLKLLEIPTSAALLPLMSALNSVSVVATELVTNMLRYEASIVQKPIVYQCHAEDFVLVERPRNPMKVTWRSLMPTRNGIPLRWALEETDGKVVYLQNEEFLNSVMRTNVFQFLTVDQYLDRREPSKTA